MRRAHFAAVFLASAGAALGAAPSKAVAVLRPTQGNAVEGRVTFTRTDKGTSVNVHVTGLTPGRHGFHKSQRACQARKLRAPIIDRKLIRQ